MDPPTAGQEETTKRNYKNTSYVEVLDYELKDKETTKRNYKMTKTVGFVKPDSGRNN